MRKYLSLTILAVCGSTFLVSCADKVDESETTMFTVAANDSSCEVSAAEATTGTSTFEVTNSGEKITEFYV